MQWWHTHTHTHTHTHIYTQTNKQYENTHFYQLKDACPDIRKSTLNFLISG
jgi:hypothetical protein